MPRASLGNNVRLLGSSAVYDYKIIPGGYIVLAELAGVLYACSNDRRTLHKSVDGGDSWGAPIFTTASSILVAHKTSTGALLVFLGNKSVHRSIDDTVFVEVLSNVYPPWPAKGVQSQGDTVLFGEYWGSLPAGTSMSVYRSTNGGATWTAVITGTVGTNGFDHWHSVQRLSHNRWLATTGDVSIRWYLSMDNGQTFSSLFSGSSAGQEFRTLGVEEISLNNRLNRIVWASDGSFGNEGVYYIDIEPFSLRPKNYTPELLTLLPSVSYGLAGQKNILVATTKITNAYNNDKKSRVIVSLNAGVSWQMDNEFPVDPSVSDGGIESILGPDSQGCYYLTFRHLLSAEFTTQTIKMIPSFKVRVFTFGTYTEGRRITQKVHERAVYTAENNDIFLSPPRWAKGAIFVCRTHTITGSGTPTLKLQTNHINRIANTRGPFLESTITAANRTAAHYWYPGISAGDKSDRIDSVRITGLPLNEMMLVTLNITLGTFGAGEGIEAEVDVTWLP